jgi:hypothetical protein
MEAWIEEMMQPAYAPPGLGDWAREFPSAYDGWDACPDAEWRLWLAAYLGRTRDEQLLCAKAACLVARRIMAMSPSLPEEARIAIDSAEQWALTRETDDPHFERLERMRDWKGSPLAALADLTNSAAWFADFEACVGIEAACNAKDLFAAARELALHFETPAGVETLFRELNEELRVLLRGVVAAIPGSRPDS